MSNSSLVNYTKISPNKTVMTNKQNKKITIHHMAGNLTVETCGNVFAPTTRQASANYGIGTDGRVGMYVEEKDRAWTSSSSDNDSQAVTIEVANNSGEPNWTVSDTAYNKLIDLCVDICKRNGISKLNWTGDKTGTLTCHYMFAATACPGPYLKGKMSDIASKVNAKLGASITTTQTTSSSEMYRVRKTWADASSQIGAFSSLDNAKKACKTGYTVFNKSGVAVYTNASTTTTTTSTSTSSTKTYTVKSGDSLSTIGAKVGVAWATIASLNGIKSPYTIYAGQVLKLPSTANTTSTTTTTASTTIKAGTKIKIKSGAKQYGKSAGFASFVYSNTYTVISISGDRVVFGLNGVVTGAVAKSNVTIV